MPNKDPTPDLYKIFDKCRLTASNMLQGSASMSKIVNSVRSSLAAEISEYIKQREGDTNGGKPEDTERI